MSSELVDVLHHLLGDTPHVRAISDVGEWWDRHTRVSKSFATTIGRALVGGFASDRLGYAFASGYREALTSLVPSLVGVPAAFCMSEDAGSSPRDIETCFEPRAGGFSLRGYKSHVTLGTHADELLVVGHIGVDDHDRKRIRVARIPANRDDVIRAIPVDLRPYDVKPQEAWRKERLDHSGWKRSKKPKTTPR